MKKNIIAWDLGATKCAASIVEYNDSNKSFDCKRQFSIKISSCASLQELITQLEQGLDANFAEADAICIGGAGHYDGKNLHLESGYPYAMSFAKIAKDYNWPSFTVIHDYAPIVCATFTSYMNQPQNIKLLNKNSINFLGRRVALGLGTGLGLKDGMLFDNGDFWLGQNEMGHIGITNPPYTNAYHQKRHAELLRFLLTDNILKPNEPLTFEKILTGKGIVRLYEFFYPSAEKVTPEELGILLRSGAAKDVLALFAWYLGLFIGTVQLSFMPEGGVWLTEGSVLNRLNFFDYPDFIEGINAIPGYLTLREKFPLGILCNNEHTFIGSAYYALKRLLN